MAYVASGGEFNRDTNYITTRITADGRDGYPVEPRRSRLGAARDWLTGEVVTNDFAQMTLDFSAEWAKFHREGAPQLYPEDLRDEIDEVAKRIYTEINNGVYRCGFAGSQDSYDKAYDR